MTETELKKPSTKSSPVNIPNILTVSRFLLLPFLFVAFPGKNNFLILLIMGLVFATDILDGFLARRWGLSSTLGKVLDHAVDKFVLVGIILLLTIFRDMPWWVLALFLLREAVTSVVGIVLLRKNIEISGSNLLGKLTGVLFGATAVAYVVYFPWRVFLLWAMIVLALLASFSYIYYHFVDRRKSPGA